MFLLSLKQKRELVVLVVRGEFWLCMYVFMVGVDGFIAKQEIFYGANLTPPLPAFGKDVSETIVHSLMENLICQRHTYIMRQ